MMTEQELLIACYRSGQISEWQWQEHVQRDQELRDAWLYKIDPDNTSWNPIG